MTKADMEVLERECKILWCIISDLESRGECMLYTDEGYEVTLDDLKETATRVLELVKERDKYKNLYEHSKIC